MLSTGREQRQGESLTETYVRLTREWVRQTHMYVRSMRQYQASRELRPRRLPVESRIRPWNAQSPELELVTPTPDAPPPAARPLPALLTVRQFEIAALIARGLSNEQIARELVLTPGTVGNHVGHILRRLGARNRAQVATWVTQQMSQDALTTETAS